MSFILLGTVLENFINAVFWVMGFALKNDMDSGVMESNWLTPIPRLLILVGHSVTNLIVTAITSIGMLLLGGMIFGFNASGDVLKALLPIIPMMLGLYGFGFAFAAVVMLMREANTLVDVSSFLVQIFSGSNFPCQCLAAFFVACRVGAASHVWTRCGPRKLDRNKDHPAPAMGNGFAHRLHVHDAMDRNCHLPLARA